MTSEGRRFDRQSFFEDKLKWSGKGSDELSARIYNEKYFRFKPNSLGQIA